MSKRKPKLSPAMKLFCAAHDGWPSGLSGDQWRRVTRGIVAHAIFSGIAFGLDDFIYLAHVNDDRLGENPEPNPAPFAFCADENDYAVACGSTRGCVNPSAAQAYEHWKGRKPFLVRDRDGYGHVTQTPTRAYLGRRFRWYQSDVWVTSFDDERGLFVACSYHDGVCRGQVNKRFKITHAIIRDYHAWLKEQEAPC